MTFPPRILTESQHKALDDVAKKAPSGTVVGWDSTSHGPVVSVPRGLRVVLPDGTFTDATT